MVAHAPGIVLEEDKAGNIFVGGLVEDGNAAKSGLVDVGDQLIATSAIVYNDSETYQGVSVRKGMEVVRLSVRGERFETVIAALVFLGSCGGIIWLAPGCILKHGCGLRCERPNCCGLSGHGCDWYTSRPC